MQGTFSNISAGRSINFHKLLAISGFAGTLLFGFFFLYLLPNCVELIWDRAIILVYSLFLYLLSFKKDLKPKTYAKLILLLYYLYTTQVLTSLVLNDFFVFYVVSFFITIQAIGFSIGNERHVFWYFLYVVGFCLVSLFMDSTMLAEDKMIFGALISCLGILIYMAAKIKCRFFSDMKMNENLMKSMVSKTENSVFLTDVYGNILDVNSMALQMFGYSRKELQDNDFKILRKYELTPEEVLEGLTALSDEKFWTKQTTLVKKNLDEFPARISISLIKNGRKRFMIYYVQDITEVKNNELAIMQEKQKAEAAAKAKSQFLAVMSHEIRTPLNGVIATASLLQRADLTLEQKEYADTIKKSGDSLLMLINDILEFSKMESGNMQLDAHNASISNILFDVMKLLAPHAETKGLDLKINIDNTVPDQLWLDSHRLKQVLLNLVGNAIKFTANGSVSIDCQSLGINKKNVFLKFCVKDTGMGIPENKIHKLFKSFSQVDSSTSRKFGGTGLGLAISKQLVELMGGDITVSSAEGKGTEFSFTIKCEIAQEEINSNKAATKELSEIAIRNTKVLVAEDNEINIRVFQFMLQSLNVKADFVVNGREAVEACKKSKYDLIFMDMQMPEMDGLEATRILRKLNDYPINIVAISANAYADDKAQCMEAGMNDFLPKPFDVDQLNAVLEKWAKPSMAKMDNAA
jgi:PAS domain S-box-containing protein